MDIFSNQPGSSFTFRGQTEVTTGTGLLDEQSGSTPETLRSSGVLRPISSTTKALYMKIKDAEKGPERIFRFSNFYPRQTGDNTLQIQAKSFGASGQEQDHTYFSMLDTTWCVTDIGANKTSITSGSLKVQGTEWMAVVANRFLLAKEDGGTRWLLVIDQAGAADFACIGEVIQTSDIKEG